MSNKNKDKELVVDTINKSTDYEVIEPNKYMKAYMNSDKGYSPDLNATIINNVLVNARRNVGGRPRKYADTETLYNECLKYLETANETGLPITYIGLANYLGVHRQTLFDWEKEGEGSQFSYVIRKMRDLFEEIETVNAMTGNINFAFAIFRLKSVFGYSDKVEIDVNTKHSGTELVDKESLLASLEQLK